MLKQDINYNKCILSLYYSSNSKICLRHVCLYSFQTLQNYLDFYTEFSPIQPEC